MPLVLTPFAVGLLVLAADLAGVTTGELGALLPVGLLLALVAGPPLAAALARRSRRVVAAALAPCVLAPLGVAAAWTLTAGHLGVGFGHFGYFVHWLTRYPDLGPLNAEVLAGTLCVLGASSISVAAVVAHLRRARAATLAVLLVLQLVAYVPVLVRLDAVLLLVAARTAVTGVHPTALGPVALSLPERLALTSLAGAGALARLAATVGMVVLLRHAMLARRRLTFAATPR